MVSENWCWGERIAAPEMSSRRLQAAQGQPCLTPFGPESYYSGSSGAALRRFEFKRENHLGFDPVSHGNKLLEGWLRTLALRRCSTKRNINGHCVSAGSEVANDEMPA